MDRLSGFRDILEIQRREMGSGRKTDRAASRSSAQLPAGLQRPEDLFVPRSSSAIPIPQAGFDPRTPPIGNLLRRLSRSVLL